MIAVIPWLSLILVSVGCFLLALSGLIQLVDWGTGLYGYLHRRLRPEVVRRIMAYQESQMDQPQSEREAISFKSLLVVGLENRTLWIALGILVALMVHDVMLSSVFLLLVPLSAELYRTQVHRQRNRRLDEDASNLVLQVEARYPLHRSLARTLAEALTTLSEGVVYRAVQACIHKLEMKTDIEEALEPLMRLGHPSLSRLTLALTHAQDTQQKIFLDTLNLLREEVESRMDLRRHARRSLTVVFLTTRALQAVLVIASLVVSLIPAWRSYYTSSPNHWMLMMVSLVVAGLGSLYVEIEMRQLEGRES